MREEHRLLFGPASKDVHGEYDQANQRCGEVIASQKQSGTSPERSSSLLVDVVCPWLASAYTTFEGGLNAIPQRGLLLTARSAAAYPECMPTQHTFCCCRRSPLAYTDAR